MDKGGLFKPRVDFPKCPDKGRLSKMPTLVHEKKKNKFDF